LTKKQIVLCKTISITIETKLLGVLNYMFWLESENVGVVSRLFSKHLSFLISPLFIWNYKKKTRDFCNSMGIKTKEDALKILTEILTDFDELFQGPYFFGLKPCSGDSKIGISF
jgi:hypothetical protein